MIADMAGIDRKQAKTINLGIMYGMGKNKLMAELGLMKDAAEKLLKTYHQRAPFVKMLSEAVSRRADDSGKIRTIGGRLCHFDMWEPHGFGIKKPLKHADALREHGPGIKRAFTYKALNKLIQGSAADMTKQSMNLIYQYQALKSQSELLELWKKRYSYKYRTKSTTKRRKLGGHKMRDAYDAIMNIKTNALKHLPFQVKFMSMQVLAWMWSAVFGIYIVESIYAFVFLLLPTQGLSQ